MSANGYAVIGGFLELLRFGAASVAVVLGARTLCFSSRASRSRLENSSYLSALLAYLLLGLALASWIVLYLLLDSFVPESPGAMCIYGVTRIGDGSPGLTGWLPSLIAGVQIMKPVLVFVAGAVVVLYWLYRRAGTPTLLPRFVAGLLALGVLSLGDVAAETTYLLVPKRDVPLTTGCCSPAAADLRSAIPAENDDTRWLPPAYFACHLLMVGLLWCGGRWEGYPRTAVVVRASRLPRGSGSDPHDAPPSATWLLTALAASVATLYVSARFLVDVAAPALLHLPYHHCLYDMVGTVKESAVAIGLLLWGTFCVGWACVAAWCGRSPDTLPFLASDIRQFWNWALLGYLGSAAMFAVDLWLA
ncbi:MAG TPA: hypothetical protein VMV69_23760 [Pirellulales bacterium]|nr:hypothetical protein [Pirellulales bacterium]